MAKIRVLVVDDSAMARSLLCAYLEGDDNIEVVGEAENGRIAVQLVKKLRPNLVTMDLEMPVMGGIEAIAEIMHTQAVPILVVSSVADAQNAYAAIASGALDVLNKPGVDIEEGEAFVAKVKMLSSVRVISHIRSHLSNQTAATPFSLPAIATVAPPETGLPRVFAIASSTGGPQALALILGKLPATFPCAILISQHISDGFAAGMVKWLGSLCKLPVRLAQDGEKIMPATVYISPSETNLAVSPNRCLRLDSASPGEMYHPRCDELLNSIAEVYGRQSIGIILTGMGRDGADGIERINQAGGVTLAQDEASSVVFGMNKVAIDRGAVQQVLAVDLIAPLMCRLAGVEPLDGAGS